MDHGHDLTMPLIHVPLVLGFPGRIPKGVKVSTPVGARHVAATILSLAGLDRSSIGGKSLEPLWAGGDQSPTIGRGFSRQGELASLVTDEFHFLRGPDGRERLFAYREDPLELNDLSENPELATVRSTLREELRVLLDGGT